MPKYYEIKHMNTIGKSDDNDLYIYDKNTRAWSRDTNGDFMERMNTLYTSVLDPIGEEEAKAMLARYEMR